MSLNKWSAADVAERLSGSGKAKAKKTRQGWMVCCPAHTDRTPSLSLADGNDKLLYHCFGGCLAEDVKGAIEEKLGIQSGSNDIPQEPRKKRVVNQQKEDLEVIIPVPSDEIGVTPEDFYHFEHGLPSKVWTYRLPEGEIAGWVARYDTDEGGKEIIPWTWTRKINGSSEKLRMKGMPAPRALYNSDQIYSRKNDPILWNEGEKAADAGQKLFPGWVSTACQGGGNAISLSDFRILHGRTIIFLCDHDGPGYQAASKIVDQLIGKAKLYFLRWPKIRGDGTSYEVKPKDDAADHFERGWTAEELRAISKEHGGLTVPIGEIAPAFDIIHYDWEAEQRFRE